MLYEWIGNGVTFVQSFVSFPQRSCWILHITVGTVLYSFGWLKVSSPQASLWLWIDHSKIILVHCIIVDHNLYTFYICQLSYYLSKKVKIHRISLESTLYIQYIARCVIM